MFLQNKYTKWYFNIISKSNSLKRNKNDRNYYEKHHIIPKSLGGNNSKENLVLLTPREHYICHLLLTKMCDGQFRYKMIWALHRLSNYKFIMRSKDYSLVRNIHAKEISKKMKNRKILDETRQKISLSNIGKSKTRTKEHNKKIGDKQKNIPREYTRGNKSPLYKGTLCQFDMNMVLIKEYNGLKDLIENNFTKDAYYAASGRQKTHRGYYWKWK